MLESAASQSKNFLNTQPFHSHRESLDDTKFSNIWLCGQNPKEGPFIGKLLSSTLLWSCLFFNFTWFAILENSAILDLTLV